MKKIYVTLFMATLCSSASLFAQDAPDKKYFLGGSLGYATTDEQRINTTGSGPVVDLIQGTSISITPEFGFFIRKNVALGLKVSYFHRNTTLVNDVFSKVKSNNLDFSPFVRFLIPLWKSRFSVYNDLGVVAGFGKEKTELKPSNSTIVNMKGEAKTTHLGAFYEPGLQFRIKDNINLMATLGNLFNLDYTKKKETVTQTGATKEGNSDYVNAGINNDFFALNSFRLGVNLLF